MKPVTIYRWPDGSRVTCRVSGGLGQGAFWIHTPSAADELWIGWRSRLVFTERHQEYPTEFDRYLLGFLLDLGLTREVGSSDRDLNLTGLVSTEDDSLVLYPFFVPDDVWESRYEDARKIQGKIPGRFLVWNEVEKFEVNRENTIPPISGEKVVLHVMEGNATAVSEASTLEGAVNRLCEDLFILPESNRVSWEAEHVLRGKWVLPTQEEVELYQMLGEELPFWWKPERLLAWLEERSP